MGGVVAHRVALALALLAFIWGLLGCETPTTAPPVMTPSASCDARMIEHNARVCAERGKGFVMPTEPGRCGECAP